MTVDPPLRSRGGTLAGVLACLRCPVCAGGLEHAGTSLRCSAGHSFDVARQGYASLLTGRPHAGTADTPEMVAARAAFLDAGHFAPLAETLAALAAERAPDVGCVLDVGAGTGYYLAAVLDRLPGRAGVALDVSKPALRRAAQAHPRAGALAWDVWRPFPVRDGVVGVLVDVFAPRNGPEFRRVLGSDGVLIVVTPGPGHLGELVGPLGLLSVDDRKAERVAETLGDGFAPAGERSVELSLRLTHAEVTALAAMGPSAWHTDPDVLRARVSSLAEPIAVTAAFDVRLFDVRPES